MSRPSYCYTIYRRCCVFALLLPLLVLLAGQVVPPARADVLIPLPTSPSLLPPEDGEEEPEDLTPESLQPLLPRQVDKERWRPGEEIAGSRLFLPLNGGLRAGDQQVLFEGQEALQSFTLTLPAEALVADAEFVLSYLSSVELLPSASLLVVEVNGNEILSLQPRAFSTAQKVRVPLPDGLLRPGLNEVVITVRQNHRVLCTIESVYELWTAVDVLHSGLELRLVETLSPPNLASFDFALSSGLSGSRSLTFIALSSHPDEFWLTNAFDVVQGASRRTSGQLPEFAILSHTQLARGEPVASSLLGVDREALPKGMLAVIGTAEELRELLPRQILRFVTGPYLGVHGLGRRDGSALFIFSGRDRREVRQAVEDWMNQRVELPAGRNAITSDLPPAFRSSGSSVVAGRSSVTLADLGIPEQEVSGLRESITVELQLPDDFFAANDASVRLLLNAAYAPDLHPDSALNLLVNGRGAALIGLNKPQGHSFRDEPVELPLRYFQPGLNRVEFEITLPSVNATPEGFCAPGTVGLNQPPGFVLYGDTRFTFPAYARLGQLPNLKLLAEGGFPYLLNDQQLASKLYLGSRDPSVLAAAMTWIAAISRHAEHPLALRPVFSLPQEVKHDILAIGPTNSLQPALFANAPLRQQDLIQAWSRSRPFDPLVSDEEEAAATRVTGELLERIEALRSGSLEKRDRLDRPSSHLGTESERQPWYRQLREYLAAWGKGEPAEQLVRRMLQQSGGDVTAVMMQYEAGRSSGRTVTLLTALDGPLLLGAIKRVTQPDYWGRLRGDFAVWGTQPQSLGTAVIGGSYTMAPRERSLTNMRLILSNWLSENVAVLVISVMLAVLALSGVTYLLLRMDRRRRDLA